MTDEIHITPEMTLAGYHALDQMDGYSKTAIVREIYRAMETERRRGIEPAGKRLLVVDDNDRVIGSLPPLTTSTYSPGGRESPCGWYKVDSLSSILPIVAPDRVHARERWWPLPELRKIPGFGL